MPSTPLRSSQALYDDDEQEETQKRQIIKSSRKTVTYLQESITIRETSQTKQIKEEYLPEDIDTIQLEILSKDQPITKIYDDQDPTNASQIEVPSADSLDIIPAENPPKLISLDTDQSTNADTDKAILENIDIRQVSNTSKISEPDTFPLISPNPHSQTHLTKGKALLLLGLFLILLLHAANGDATQFLGPQGWTYVLGGPTNNSDLNLLNVVKNHLRVNTTPGTTTQKPTQLTPEQYINLIIQNMSLDQKLGQMMIVQFTGPDFSLALNTMVNQYHVGAVLLFYSNNNIIDKTQLKLLDQQIQNGRTIPLAIALDQEGGQVDRLRDLDGPRPAASTIGATNDPNRAIAAGIQDAQDLSSYGINLNLAPVVDVTNVFNPQLYMRTYGKDPTTVTKMAGAYLQGLQQSGKVIGTLKHFPGLGDVSVDPHNGIPHLTRSLKDLEQIDWAPDRTLIQQGNVHAIMVTHEIVTAVDSTKPSSLSHKLVQGILRDNLGFQGVIMTDSLTMAGVTDYYTPSQAAVLAVEAGNDLLMGASSPNEVGAMIDGIKQAINAGEISQQRIDDSVRRLLLMKYAMGLLPIPTI